MSYSRTDTVSICMRCSASGPLLRKVSTSDEDHLVGLAEMR
jgi:hypothetical protein